jgi:hypothetical protein
MTTVQRWRHDTLIAFGAKRNLEVRNMKRPRTIIAILTGVFITSTSIGRWLEYHPAPDYVGVFAVPGLVLGSILGMGVHDSVDIRIVGWAWAICNGVFYAGFVGLVIWLWYKISK